MFWVNKKIVKTCFWRTKSVGHFCHTVTGVNNATNVTNFTTLTTVSTVTTVTTFTTVTNITTIKQLGRYVGFSNNLIL